MDDVASVILAGGEGTRLFPLTRGRCKPDVSFAGRYRLIDIPISNSIHSQIKKIFVLTQRFTESLHQHIGLTYCKNAAEAHHIEIVSSNECKGQLYRGTADAVRQNRDRIQKSACEYVLILAGDQLYHMDFSELIHYAKSTNADMTIASLVVTENEARRMGLIKINHLGEVVDFFEKPNDPAILKRFELPSLSQATPHYLGSMGIYVFKKSALLSLLSEEGDDFGKHLIPKQVKREHTSAFIYRGYWEDIGTVSAYYLANLALTQDNNWMQSFQVSKCLHTPLEHLATPYIKNGFITNCIINQGAVISAQAVENSVIGLNVQIQEGSIVQNSILIGDPILHQATVIGKECRIQKCIIDANVMIADHVTLMNLKNVSHYDSEFLFVRDGIIIITSGARISENFSF